jgi:hypothetical protein
MWLLYILIGFLSVIVPAQAADGAYLCIGDMAQGLRFRNGHWAPAQFKPHKMMIRTLAQQKKIWPYLDEKEAGPYTVSGFSDADTAFLFTRCTMGGDTISCNDSGDSFFFSKKTGRFIATTISGAAIDPVGNDPIIEVGTCTPL